MENTAKHCPVCDGQVGLFDVVDFNKSCEEIRGKFLPLSGVPIYYVQCSNCLFTFAPEFKNWSENDFLEKIYNDQYIEIDPDYSEARPQANCNVLEKPFGGKKILLDT
jgi:2-polyprenyl-6-hydroxyphenyl methylase/3-demethylubiquinone-9 3-methyltransferase